MTPGLCLDSGEFIPASELNQRIDVNPFHKTIEDMIMRIRAQDDQIKQLTASLETASGAVIVLKQQQRERWAQLASGQESVALHENIKNLCDQYAQECVQFALGIKAGSGSMSPIASLAGDTRLTLHTAIDCTKPPAQKPLGIEEIQKLAADNATGWLLGPLTFARAIEAKHGIKEKP